MQLFYVPALDRSGRHGQLGSEAVAVGEQVRETVSRRDVPAYVPCFESPAQRLAEIVAEPHQLQSAIYMLTAINISS
jgi:hypothetical protein